MLYTWKKNGVITATTYTGKPETGNSPNVKFSI
jgi:hypothetical protein